MVFMMFVAVTSRQPIIEWSWLPVAASEVAGAGLLSGRTCVGCSKPCITCALLLPGLHCCSWLPTGSTGETGTRSGASLSDLTYSDVSQPGSVGSEQAST